MPSDTIEYGRNLLKVDEGVFYVPESETQVGLDSFIVVGGVPYIFQFTIASNHAINPLTSQFLGGLRRIGVLCLSSLLVQDLLARSHVLIRIGACSQQSFPWTLPPLPPVEPERDLRATKS